MARASDVAESAPVISVTMDEGRVVIRPVGHLDRETIEAVEGLLAGARAAGAHAVVDVAQVDRRDRKVAGALVERAAGTLLSSLNSASPG